LLEYIGSAGSLRSNYVQMGRRSRRIDVRASRGERQRHPVREEDAWGVMKQGSKQKAQQYLPGGKSDD